MRSIEDVVVLTQSALAKRQEVQRNALQETTSAKMSNARRMAVQGAHEAGKALIADLTDLYTALTVKPKPDETTAMRLCMGLLLKWRTTANRLLSETFSVSAKTRMEHQNRYLGNQALEYALLVDEFSHALETRDQYESLTNEEKPPSHRIVQDVRLFLGGTTPSAC